MGMAVDKRKMGPKSVPELSNSAVILNTEYSLVFCQFIYDALEDELSITIL
jgi:hypothetical protein